jgi:hypothetical protein
MHLRTVVFPHPEGPRRTTNSLSFASKSSLLTATTLPKRFVNCLIKTLAKTTTINDIEAPFAIKHLRSPIFTAVKHISVVAKLYFVR